MDALQGAIDVDTNIFFSINRMHNMYFDYFMSAYSGKWVWIPMYAAIWYVMLRNFHWKVTLFCMIGLALTITFADQACATWIRPYVERMRPSNLNNPISEMVHIANNTTFMENTRIPCRNFSPPPLCPTGMYTTTP